MQRDSHAALAWMMLSFIIAGSAGVLLRLSQYWGFMPLGLTWENVRHAHSHLMLFSWVTPGLFLLFGQNAQISLHRAQALRVLTWAAIAFGLGSFFPFALSGYKSTPLFGRALPLSIVMSTLSMFVWYGVIMCLFSASTRLKGRTAAHRLKQAALASLGVSTLGAWARAILMATGHQDGLWPKAAVQFFLTTFTMGWLLFGVLALLYREITGHKYEPIKKRSVGATVLMLMGLTTLWMGTLPATLTPWWMRSLGALGAASFGFGLYLHVGILWAISAQPKRRTLLTLAAVGLVLVAGAWPGISAWAQGAGLTLVLLHVIFLGVVTVELIERLIPIPHPILVTAVWSLILLMWPTTTLWPWPQLTGKLAMVALGAAAAPAAMLLTLGHWWRHRQEIALIRLEQLKEETSHA